MSTFALIRLAGEISTKARPTRRHFVGRLLRNAKDALESTGVRFELEKQHDRIFVEVDDPSALQVLTRVFGLQSISPAHRHPVQSLDQILELGTAAFAEVVRGRRFAVRAKLVGGSTIPGVRARAIEIELGTKLLAFGSGVDLTKPDVTVRVEIYRGEAYFFDENLPAPGGLPLGTENRALALVSGGFDSPVAAWQLLRRGVNLDYLFCNLGGFSHQLGALRVMQVLANDWSYGTRPRFHSVDFSAVSREIKRASEPRYWQVILKRCMMRAAEAVAEEIGAQALVSGEAVGQVSSQTLVNLRTISDVVDLPILRPVIGSNKEEIIAMARRIGTAPLSSVVDEYCDLLVERPATGARADVVGRHEARMDPQVLARAIEAREVIDLRDLDPDDCGMPELEIDHVPEGACLLDLRQRRDYDAWHPSGALWMEFDEAREACASFSKDQVYVLACEFGLKSAHLAELMREVGHRAFHFRGGTRALRAWLEKQTPDATRERRG